MYWLVVRKSESEPIKTLFRIETLTLPLNDFQLHESYNHDPYTCKRSGSKVIRGSEVMCENRRMDGRTKTKSKPGETTIKIYNKLGLMQ